MSFALEYRRKRIAKVEEASRADRRKQEEGFAAPAPRKKADTAGNRLRVLAALVVAAVVLGLFNSASLVGRTQSLHETSIGRHLIVASEKWHGMMESGKLTMVVDSIRGAVTGFRETTWQDVAEYFAPLNQGGDTVSLPHMQSQVQMPPAEAATAPTAADAAKLLRGSVQPESDEKPGATRDGPLKSVQADRAGY